MSNTDKSYLGDGVYVEIENGMFRLYTDDGRGAQNVIYLEVEVYDAFKSYAERIFKKYNKKDGEASANGS